MDPIARGVGTIQALLGPCGRIRLWKCVGDASAPDPPRKARISPVRFAKAAKVQLVLESWHD